MALAMAGQPLARNDRHVRRARLRIGASAPRHRLVFNIEEALRLCSLPSENEGRVYCFRYLHVGGLPANGDRRAWLDELQRALLELARRAVHGADDAARAADAVFFLNEQEACEIPSGVDCAATSRRRMVLARRQRGARWRKPGGACRRANRDVAGFADLVGCGRRGGSRCR